MFTPHFLKFVAELKSLGLPHVLKLRLGVSKGMFPLKYFAPTNTLRVRLIFLEIVGQSQH